MKHILFLLMIAGLSACTPQPLEEYGMRADDKVYSQIQNNYFLKEKLALQPITSDIDDVIIQKLVIPNVSQSAQLSLTKAGLMTMNLANAQFILRTNIKDITFISCRFGSCEGGSAIEYTLINAKTKKISYHDTLVVPFNYEYPAYGSNMDMVFRKAIGGAIGNNFAHLIHVLTQKTKEDLK